MLPKGWKKLSLSTVAEVRTGVAKGKQNLKNPVELPYLRVANVQDGYIDISNIKTIQIERDQIERYSLKAGDVLMTEGGDFDKLGRGDVWNGEICPCLHQNHVFAVRTDPSILTPNFLAALSASRYGKAYFLGCAKKSTNLASINSTQLKEFPVLLPPVVEQQKITKILSTWDQAISTTEKLLANSQQQKKALMQVLLTSQIRFPEFGGEWKRYKLKQVCDFKKGYGLSKDLISSNGKYKCILYGQLYTKYGEVIKNIVSRTDSEEGAKSVAGDILIPSSTTTTGIDLANAVALLEDNVLLGGDINILRPNRSLVCSIFIAHLLTHIKKHQIASFAQGVTIIHLYGNDLKHLNIELPKLEEQQKIAQALTTADREIETLQQKLACLKQEKKALMQQLLTGKRRVKVDES